MILIVKRLRRLIFLCLGIGNFVDKTEHKDKKSGQRKKVDYQGCGISFYERKLKRILDFVLALMAMLLLCPVLLITALLVRVKLGSPIIFVQPRPGMKDQKTGQEQIFDLYKFRTMTDEHDDSGKLLPDEKRLTEFGINLRSSSLDELPELINILKGDMSIVGPRPQLIRDMVFMSDEHRKRHDVRPGFTGLAQVSGRNGITWEEKLDKDIDYIMNITFLGDLRIVLATVKTVLQKNGINELGQATASDYGDWLLRVGRIDKKEYDRKQEKAQRIENGKASE